MNNQEFNEKNKAALEYLKSPEYLKSKDFQLYNSVKPNIEVSLSPEAELALRLLPFVIDNFVYNGYTLKQQIFKAQDLAKEFMNYKP